MLSDNQTHPLPPDELGDPPVDQALFAQSPESPTTPPPTTIPPKN